MKSRFLFAFLLGTFVATAVASPASAFGTHTYGVNLTVGQEVPPPGGGASGVGGCTVTLDDVTGLVTVSGSYTGMTSTATSAHIHNGAPGVAGGIILALSTTGGTVGNFSGSGTISPANITNMLNGNTYVNVHTTTNPLGEIRGQIVTPVPALSWQGVAGLVVLAIAGGAFVLMRRGSPAVA
jgi:hypothetical protein